MLDIALAQHISNNNTDQLLIQQFWQHKNWLIGKISNIIIQKPILFENTRPALAEKHYICTHKKITVWWLHRTIAPFKNIYGLVFLWCLCNKIIEHYKATGKYQISLLTIKKIFHSFNNLWNIFHQSKRKFLSLQGLIYLYLTLFHLIWNNKSCLNCLVLQEALTLKHL